MKTRLKRIAICSMVISLLLSGQTSAYAEPVTEAKIEIIAGTGPTTPVNPEIPDEDVPGGEPVTGALAIVNVSDFDFGTIPVTQATGLYGITTSQPNIQVVDLRGTGTGWSVNAKVSGFASNATPSLPGAVIYIYSGRPNSLASATYAPSQIANVALTSDNTEKKVITAPDGTGMGLWVMRWYPLDEEPIPYIKLEIPAGVATTGSHTATITWTLSNTP